MSRADAEADIARIRHDKGLSDANPSGHNVADLENALTTLSEQLYQSSTHFLLELIQNADDNSYNPRIQPSVHFTYSSGHLRVDCNEVGFSPRNVEALCRVGKSTKKGGDNATRYVGEKGIGFKSVFKAADVVWISSGHYSFKFDKSKPLGMIAPIWDAFPVPTQPGWTSLYLQLSKDYNLRGLIDELRSMDSRLLIFLRRLQCIKISVSEPLRLSWSSSFSRAEIGKDLIRLTENKKTCDYIIRRHQVTNMPQELKRQGVSSSEIILGFPIYQDGQPRRVSQQAYAFLPIRDYGFEFLIQADFLLIASREDIDSSSQWNHALRNALYPAFLESMKEFNKGKLRYQWPRYLPIREPLQSFLKPFHLEFREKLKLEKLFYSQSGDQVRPNNLIYVPEKFTYNGAPLTISTQNSARYLSGRYSESDLKFLEVLGVEELTDETFFAELTSSLQNAIGDFMKRSDAWHSNLACALMRFPKQYFDKLTNLPLIPLKTGIWVAANGRQILFPATKAEFELPDGLELSVVDAKAASDPARRKLYLFLGVGDFGPEPVVRHIQDLHVKNRVDCNSVSQTALISQIKFLYAASWKNPEFQRFWFIPEFGQRVRGSHLYQDSEKQLSASFFFGAHRNKYRFIHADYMASIGKGKQRDLWVAWLQEKMDVAIIPRLVATTTERGFKLSEDFEFIIKNFPSATVLMLLRENWDEYSRFFDSEQVNKWKEEDIILKYDSKNFYISAQGLRQKLGSMLVTCRDGKKFRLDTTFLPSKELLVAAQEGVPFVKLQDPDNHDWKVLEALGVKTKVDVTVYLRCLEELASQESSDHGRIAKLYDAIQYRCNNEGEATIKKLFTNKKLIYMPATRKDALPTWLPLSECRWKGPPMGKGVRELRTFKVLKDIYPGNADLFCKTLLLEDCTMYDLLSEAGAFTRGDSLKHITTIFHTMEKFLEEDDENPVSTSELCDRSPVGKIFPVSKNWNLDTDEATSFMDSRKSSEWFIADTAPLRTTFAGVVPLLDFEVDDLNAMDQVLTELGLKDRFLSKQAKSVPRTQGSVELDEELTKAFKWKVEFIIRLIPTNKSHRARRQEIITQLQNLQVFTASEVIQEWTVTYKRRPVKGPPGNGRAALATKNDKLKIYLAAKGEFDMEQMPMELVDEMFHFLGMQEQNPAHGEMCLHIALSCSNPAMVSKVFADKGIPSLESLKFVDVRNGEGDDEGWVGDRDGKGLSGKGNKLKVLKDLPLIVLGLPVGLAMGVGELLKSRKVFDGSVPGDDDQVATPETNPNPEKEKKVKTPKSGPNIFEKFQNSLSKGLPRLQLATYCTEAIAYKGELYVHKILLHALKESYNPSFHWISHPSHHPSSNHSYSTFTFPDPSGTFTQLLQSHHYPSASNWLTKPPRYHIDVKSTMGDVKEEFKMSNVEFERAKKWSVMVQALDGEEGSVPSDVYILARVFGVIGWFEKEKEGDANEEREKEGKVVFLVDPWEYYHVGRLKLSVKGKILGEII